MVQKAQKGAVRISKRVVTKKKGRLDQKFGCINIRCNRKIRLNRSHSKELKVEKTAIE